MEEELPKLLHLLKSVPELCNEASMPINNLLGKIKNGQCDTSKGLSFLEVKNHMLLDYLINITQILLKKCSGQPIVGSPSVDRLVEIRTVLERIKPIEHKLKYQIDKLLKTASSGILDQNDPLLLRANPDNFISSTSRPDEHDNHVDYNGDKDDMKRYDGKTGGKYVPPRLSAVHYNDGGGGGSGSRRSKEEKILERAKKRALSSSIMKEIRSEYYDEPEEIVETSHTNRRKASSQRQERIQYEEDTMTRVTVSKKQRRMERSGGSHNLAAHLTSFGGADVSAITADSLDMLSTSAGGQRRKRKKVEGKKKGKSKKYKGKKFKRRKTI